jgi:hypothetical protein
VFLFLEHVSMVNVAFQSVFSFENISKQCFCIFLSFKIYFLQEINIVMFLAYFYIVLMDWRREHTIAIRRSTKKVLIRAWTVSVGTKTCCKNVNFGN